MGQYLDKLAVGSTVDVKGPLGEIEYKVTNPALANVSDMMMDACMHG
jgi:hypothetical protein